jgi:hypothetical protein
MSKIVPEYISIFFVKVYKSNHAASPEYLDNPQKPSNIKVRFAQESAINETSQNVRIRLEIILDGVDENENEIGLHGEWGIEFKLHVENLSQFLVESENDQGKSIDGKLGPTLLAIVYSTARGIIIERTQATYFNGVILPVIDPNELLK